MIAPEPHAHGVRYRMLETVRAFAARAARRARRAARRRSTALAEWVATITDLPFDDPCSAAVERNSIRLEREADNWREAVRRGRRVARPATWPPGCAARRSASSCSAATTSPTSCGPLLDVLRRATPAARAVLCALIVSAAGGTDPAQLPAWADEVAAIDDATTRPGSAG